jgi:lysophospholipase L1-like esterase
MTRWYAYLSMCLFGACVTANAKDSVPHWIDTWSATPTSWKLAQPAGNTTFHNIIHTTLGGNAVRVTLTNEFGTTPLQLGAAHVARSIGGGNIDPATDHALTFGGRATITIPSGAIVVSDPVPLPVGGSTDLAVSIFLPDQPIASPTCHEIALTTNYITPSDTTSESTLQTPQRLTSWCFIKGVEVEARTDTAAIVALGDSITDGSRSTIDTNRRWTDNLFRRLQEDKKTSHLAVLDEGLGGNRLLYDGHGPNTLSRFDRDVLGHAGVKFLILFEGINDISSIARPTDPERTLTVQDLIFAATQLSIRAHRHGIKIYGATITPNSNTHSATQEGEAIRQAYNNWLRSNVTLDGCIDFDRAVRDPNDPHKLLPANDGGDGIHPSDQGFRVMADAIDLHLFY